MVILFHYRVGQVLTIPEDCELQSENLVVGELKEHILEDTAINEKSRLTPLIIEDSKLVGISQRIQEKIKEEMNAVNIHEQKAQHIIEREYRSSFWGYIESHLLSIIVIILVLLSVMVFVCTKLFGCKPASSSINSNTA